MAISQSTITYKQKLEKLEYELLKLKKEGSGKSSKISLSLKGVWKGVKVTDSDIAKAKKSLFRSMK